MTSESEMDRPAELLASTSADKKWKNWWTRSVTTFGMVGGFVAILLAGHFWVILLVVAIQLAVYREVISIAHVPSKEKKLPWFRLINWYFLASTNYFLYGESLVQYFYNRIPQFLKPLAVHHRFISFGLYCFGLVFFVLNLKKGHYKFQFAQFAWTHMALLLVVVQSHAIINNILEGLIWFFLPVSLVIVNDVFAYIFGFFWGRTPLIKLSPKKTWEGFIGGALSTLIFGFLASAVLIRFPYMICPVSDLHHTKLNQVTCDPSPVFLPKQYELPAALVSLAPAFLHLPTTVSIAPFQFHIVVLSLFASSIAPFGGFFASGVKRAFKIKDFGDSIPGHGGITDRMDCQFIMGAFSYIYITSFVGKVAFRDVMHKALQLSVADQVQLWAEMGNILRQSGALDNSSLLTPHT
ncbi:phosphatidate cytidylyltransferase [Sorochytrium milnesiophthora]